MTHLEKSSSTPQKGNYHDITRHRDVHGDDLPAEFELRENLRSKAS
jgi:hypothetical protein